MPKAAAEGLALIKLNCAALQTVTASSQILASETNSSTSDFE